MNTIVNTNVNTAGQVGSFPGNSTRPVGPEENESARFVDLATQLASTLKSAALSGTKTFASSDLRALEIQWETRNHGWTLSTAGYQACQRRLLVFVALHQSCRSKIFLQAVQQAVSGGFLKYSSAATYWVAIQTATKALGLEKLSDAAKIQTWLEAKAAVEPIVRKTCTMEQVQAWGVELPFHLMALIIITFAFGQRFSDMIQCALRSVVEIEYYLALTIYDGKVIPVIGPYTMHVLTNSWIGNLLMQAVTTAAQLGWTHIFIPPTSTKAVETAKVSLVLASVGLRALRRGGLQAMALAKAPLEEILLFSKHGGVPMLNKYLLNGIVVLHNAEKTANVIEATTSTSSTW